MNLTEEDRKLIVYEDHEDWKPEEEEQITGQSRWSTFYERVFKHIPSDKFYNFYWQRGSTEYQDEGACDIEFYEVEKKEVLTTVWVAKEASE